MRKITLFSTAAALVLALSTPVFAETSVTSNVTNGTAEVQITSDNQKGLYTVYLLKSGKTAADITDETDAFLEVEQLALTFEEGKTFGTGAISFKLPSYGAYTAIVGGGELSGKELKLAYSDPTAAVSPIAELKAATAATIDSVLTKAEYNGTYWYADTENAAYKTNKSAVMSSLVEIVNDAADGAGVTEAYNKACAIAALKTCTAADFYDTLFMAEPIVGITYGEEVYKKTDAMSKAFVSLRSTETLNTPSDLEKLLVAAEATAKLNEATRDTIISVIEAYSDVFGLDLDGNDYIGADKYNLAKKLVVTEGDTYDSIEEIQIRFGTALKEVIAESSGGGSIGGGSIGGGSIGGGSIGGGIGTILPDLYPTQGSDAAADSSTGFTDVDEAYWARPYILYLAENKIMTGDGDGKFRPGDKVLREEFLKTLIEALKLADNADLSVIEKFTDVDTSAWYAKYIAAGVKHGIINGKEENLFGTGDEITRQDAAVMVNRAVAAAGFTLYAEQEAVDFTDEASISDYAKEAVEALQKAGVINGYETGELCPQNSILRSETAKIVYCMLSGINK